MADLNAGWLRMTIGKLPNGRWVLTHSPDANNTLHVEIDHNFAESGTDVVKFVHWTEGQDTEYRRDEQWADDWEYAQQTNEKDIHCLPLSHSGHRHLFEQMVAQWETLQMFVDFEVCSPVYAV